MKSKSVRLVGGYSSVGRIRLTEVALITRKLLEAILEKQTTQSLLAFEPVVITRIMNMHGPYLLKQVLVENTPGLAEVITQNQQRFRWDISSVI
jgi:hypothetical protein